MQIILLVISIISITCFILWSRVNAINLVPTLNRIAYFAGPIHFTLSLPFYILFTLYYGFHANWFTLFCGVIILANICFFLWIFKKFDDKNPLDLFVEIPELTALPLITIVPNAFIISTLGIIPILDPSVQF